MKRLLLAVSLVCLGGAAHATCPVVPYIFSNGTPIPAPQLNTDLESLRDCINAAVINSITVSNPPVVIGRPAVWGNIDGTLLSDPGLTLNYAGGTVNLGTLNATGPLTVGTTVTTGGNIIVGDGSIVRVSGTGAYQLGGAGGPYVLNDGAMDTISVQAQPGAAPSGDTTNFQLYPPIVGGQAYLNITKSAILSPHNEERLILGTNGSVYIFQQVLAGAGTCHNVSFMDGQSAVPAFSMICGAGGNPPTLALGKGAALVGEGSIAFEGMMRIDTSDDLVIGQGVNIQNIVTSHPIQVGAGGVVFNTATPTTTTGQIGLGTTTAVATSCGSIAGATGCWVVDVGGTPRAIPFF